ncbi:MAG: chemoreceptor glutamine deamidase CheD [Gammaproteobacteria bacterium]|nr:chemoreceptor glutamine deamidase CheD [Gammaproteobacteria bacterium]
MAIGSRSARCTNKVISGFEHIHRYYDSKFDSDVAKILPGEYYVTAEDEGILTVLGSCISACIRDRLYGIGGMNHFMLPLKMEGGDLQQASDIVGAAERYGNFAMEHLINDILKSGGRRENLEVKVFGGGRVLKHATDVGLRNIEFVRNYLSMENLKIIAEDVGDTCPRKIFYFPATGVVKMKRVRALQVSKVATIEKNYLEGLKQQPVEGEVDLF